MACGQCLLQTLFLPVGGGNLDSLHRWERALFRMQSNVVVIRSLGEKSQGPERADDDLVTVAEVLHPRG